MIFFATIYFLIVTIGFILWDYRLWLKHKDVKHKTEWWVKAGLLTPAIAALASNTNLYPLLSVPLCSGILAFTFWFLFDGFYNLFRGFNFWFNGSPDLKQDDSLFDKFLRNLLPWQDAVVKLLPLSVMIYLYCKTIQ